jgi:hypothetical protein
MFSLLKEATVVGVIAAIVGIVLHTVSLHVYGHHDLNDMVMFAGHLFGVGVLVHVIAEYTGVNKWYCTNGLACKI